MVDKNHLFPIGIGTWGVGGYVQRDNSIDEKRQLEALIYMLQKGMNIVEANNWYSQGHAVEILSKAIVEAGIRREKLFIVQAIYLQDKDINCIEAEIDDVMQVLNTNYIDSLQIISLKYGNRLYTEDNGFEKIAQLTESLIEKGKIRFTSVTNESLPVLKMYRNRFGNKLFSQEVCFNFEIRTNVSESLISYANQFDIKTIVYQPLRRNRTANRNWPLLIELAQKYNKTQNQIILAWMITKGYLPLTKSETLTHIDEHLDSLTIKLQSQDIARLDSFTPPGYIPPLVDWDKIGIGVSIDQFSNVFDESYDKTKTIT